VATPPNFNDFPENQLPKFYHRFWLSGVIFKDAQFDI